MQPELGRRPVKALFSENKVPEQARKARVEGRVRLRLRVDDQGRVSEVEVVESLGYGCDEAAVAAARRITFSPAMRKNQPIATWFLMSFAFEDRSRR